MVILERYVPLLDLDSNGFRVSMFDVFNKLTVKFCSEVLIEHRCVVGTLSLGVKICTLDTLDL